MYLFLLLFAVVSGPAIYILITLVGQRAKSYEDYHYGGRRIKLYEFIDTTMMYALQVAAITLFATWGFQFGFWAILVPAFWAVGYLIIARLIERGTLDDFLKQSSIGTIHQFISEKGHLRILAVIAALASLLGIAGPAFFEADFSGQLVGRLIISHLAPDADISIASKYSTIFFIAFVAMAATYMLHSGFTAVVRTDVYQLGIGYTAFSSVIAVLLYQIGRGTHFIAAFAILLVVLSLSIVTLYYWFTRFNDSQTSKELIRGALPYLIVTIFYAAAFLLILLLPNANKSDLLSISAWNTFLSEHQFGNPLSLGLFATLSLFIANALYQLVDIGQWQRLASVNLEGDYDQSRILLARSVRQIMGYSAISWVIAVFFGMILRYVSPEVSTNPYDAVMIFLTKYQNSMGLSGQIIVLVFVVGIISIMLSTLDSLVSCITFTLHNDWILPFNPKMKTPAVARGVTVIFLLIAFMLYSWLGKVVQNFSDILYSCWSFQIALFPLVYASFKGTRVSGYVYLFSLLAGMGASLVPIIYGPPLSPYEHGPLLSLGSSCLVMFIGGLFFKTK